MNSESTSTPQATIQNSAHNYIGEPPKAIFARPKALKTKY